MAQAGRHLCLKMVTASDTDSTVAGSPWLLDLTAEERHRKIAKGCERAPSALPQLSLQPAWLSFGHSPREGFTASRRCEHIRCKQEARSIFAGSCGMCRDRTQSCMVSQSLTISMHVCWADD